MCVEKEDSIEKFQPTFVHHARLFKLRQSFRWSWMHEMNNKMKNEDEGEEDVKSCIAVLTSVWEKTCKAIVLPEHSILNLLNPHFFSICLLCLHLYLFSSSFLLVLLSFCVRFLCKISFQAWMCCWTWNEKQQHDRFQIHYTLLCWIVSLFSLLDQECNY